MKPALWMSVVVLLSFGARGMASDPLPTDAAAVTQPDRAPAAAANKPPAAAPGAQKQRTQEETADTEEASAEQPEPLGPPTIVESGKIVQLSANSPRAKVLFSNPVPAGTSVSVVDSAGNECAGQITEAKVNAAIVEFLKCSTFSKIKVGNIVKASFAQSNEADEAAVKAAMPATEGHKRTIRFSGALTYDTSSQMAFNNVSGNYSSGFSTVPVSGSVTYQMATTVGLNAEVLMDQPHHLGFHAGFNFEYPRAINSYSYNLVGSGAVLANSGSLSSANISFITLYGDLSYRFSGVFLEIGPNVVAIAGSVPTVLGSPQPGFGGQVGGGYYITENIAVELICRYISFSNNSTVSTNGLNLSTGATQVLSGNLAIKFIL